MLSSKFTGSYFKTLAVLSSDAAVLCAFTRDGPGEAAARGDVLLEPSFWWWFSEKKCP